MIYLVNLRTSRRNSLISSSGNCEVIGMPRLKLKVESTLHKYLTDELTDEGFRKSIHLILTEFKGKNLLHKNIGQLTHKMERENPSINTSLRESGFCLIKLVQELGKTSSINGR